MPKAVVARWRILRTTVWSPTPQAEESRARSRTTESIPEKSARLSAHPDWKRATPLNPRRAPDLKRVALVQQPDPPARKRANPTLSPHPPQGQPQILLDVALTVSQGLTSQFALHPCVIYLLLPSAHITPNSIARYLGRSGRGPRRPCTCLTQPLGTESRPAIDQVRVYPCQSLPRPDRCPRLAPDSLIALTVRAMPSRRPRFCEASWFSANVEQTRLVTATRGLPDS